MYWEHFDSPIGRYQVVCDDEAVVGVHLLRGFGSRRPRPNALTRSCVAQLEEYFRGERRRFELPIRFEKATAFQRRVWGELLKIPYGETRTYRQLAESVGTKGYRAVGAACGANPIEVVVPCHRVVGVGGLGGYSAGLEAKIYLLALEARVCGRPPPVRLEPTKP